jgi:hypothetical protein
MRLAQANLRKISEKMQKGLIKICLCGILSSALTGLMVKITLF